MDLGGAKGGVKSDINMTPLVAVMLVLLIIMMLVADVAAGRQRQAAHRYQYSRQARSARPDGHTRKTGRLPQPKQIQEGELATKVNVAPRELE
jgi:hypothetical protein